MRKILIILLTFISILYLSACSADSKKNNDQEIVQTTATTESKPITESTEMLATEQTETNNGNVDGDLEGVELLKSLVINEPNDLKVVTEMSGSGMNFTSTSYYKDGNYRTEMDMAGLGNQITIYNLSEGVTYQYTEGDTTGLKMTEDANMYDEGEAIEVPDLNDLMDSDSDILSAKLEMLDGEKTVMIETASNEEGLGDVSVKMWYSINYGIPLKYEMLINGQASMTSKVTELDANLKLDSKLFEAPAGVDFIDYNMNNMFDIPSGDD